MANTSGATRYTSNQGSLTRTRSSGLYSGRGSARHHAGCPGDGGDPCVATGWQVASVRMSGRSMTRSTHRSQPVMHLLDGDGARSRIDVDCIKEMLRSRLRALRVDEVERGRPGLAAVGRG